MRLTEFSIRNHQFTMVVFALLVMIGLSSFFAIPRTEDPYFPISAFRVVAIYPGADPAEIEQQVAKPIEDAINELDDVKDLFSISLDSVGFIPVEFQAHVDVDAKYDEIVRQMTALRPKLPPGLKSLEVFRINPGLVNIVQFALVSETASYAQLAEAAEGLQDRLEKVSGVRTVKTWAYPRREVRITLDLNRVAQYGLRISDILNVIGGENTNIPGGAVEENDKRFNIKTSGAYKSLDEIRNTVIAGAGLRGALAGQTIRVSDIAQVAWDYESEEYTGRLDGKRAVFVSANQKDARNIFKTVEGIEKEQAAFAKTLPSDIQLEWVFDQSRNVDKRLSRLNADFLIAVVLVLVTLIPLGLRAAGIVMVSIPLSLVSGLAALHFAGFSLNQLSIAGFVVALGLLVDDSIVVIENIARVLRQGFDRTTAALMATRQITLAVLGCTATLLFAFLPLLMLPGNSGKFIRSLPLSVVFTVLASLFVALTIIPFLASRFLPRTESEHGNVVLQRLMSGIDRVYGPLLRMALAYPGRTVAISMGLFVASLALVPLIGFSLFPKADTPQFLVQVNLPDGASLKATDASVRQAEKLLMQQPEVAHVVSNIGRGNPQIFYNVFQKEQAANYGEIFVQLHEYHGVKTPLFIDRMRTALAQISGANVLIREFENGPPQDAPIGIRILGPDLDGLRKLSLQVEDVMEKAPGAQAVVNPQRATRVDLQMVINREKAGLLGVPSVELDQTVRLAIAGRTVGEFTDNRGENYPIVVRGPMQGRSSLDALDGFHVTSLQGAQVPLAQLAELKLSSSPNVISHYQRERSVLLTAVTRTGYNTAAVSADIMAQLAKLDLPPGYRIEEAGEAETRKKSFEGFGAAILITVFGILAILVLEFGSLKSSLIVLTVIPLGVMGGLLMLFLSGYTLSFTAMVGFIALIGIEIKNSILLVDFTNQLRNEGKSIDDAVEEAGQVRFLPILLTSATAIGGLLPLALQQSGLYSPMAWVIIGGLISSTLVGRFVTPVMYKLLPPDLHSQSHLPSDTTAIATHQTGSPT